VEDVQVAVDGSGGSGEGPGGTGVSIGTVLIAVDGNEVG